MMRTFAAIIVAVFVGLTTVAFADGHADKKPAASVYIISPTNGATVSGPVTVKFGLKGYGVAPAGVEKAKTGHHHLLINTKLDDFENPIPADDQHIHFGGGQTQTTIELPPGKHTLQLVLGDHNHIPHKPVIQSEVVTITVTKRGS